MKTNITYNRQGYFLFLLFKKFGGPYRVAAMCDLSHHLPFNWCKTGRGVPLRHLEKVSKVLKVDRSGLNFAVYSKFAEATWPNVLDEYELTTEEKKDILKKPYVESKK